MPEVPNNVDMTTGLINGVPLVVPAAAAWRNSLDDTLLSAVLTLETVGDHLRSGGSIISVVPENARPGSAEAAVKAALASWVAGRSMAEIVAPSFDEQRPGRPRARERPAFRREQSLGARVALVSNRLRLRRRRSARRNYRGQWRHQSRRRSAKGYRCRSR